ncbi:MAG: hypothetical protein ACHRXM_19340 [Isosphaerales bacterium]
MKPKREDPAVTALQIEPRRMLIANQDERMLITRVILPRLGVLPFALTMLIGNILSISALQWLLMPQWNRILAFWLQPAALIDRRSNFVGTLVVLGAILGMLVVFLALGLHI